jgi:hypothetical protein
VTLLSLVLALQSISSGTVRRLTGSPWVRSGVKWMHHSGSLRIGYRRLSGDLARQMGSGREDARRGPRHTRQSTTASPQIPSAKRVSLERIVVAIAGLSGRRSSFTRRAWPKGALAPQ